MTKHILLATDGSTHALKAARFAGELARAFSARVSMFTVMDPQALVASVWGSMLPPLSAPVDQPDEESYQDRLLAEIMPPTKDALGELAEEPVAAHTWGHPARDICEYAKEHDVDHIVMGSHGRSAIGAALLGSVSHGVVNRAPCAVTIIR